jgi:hypothetical protein
MEQSDRFQKKPSNTSPENNNNDTTALLDEVAKRLTALQDSQQQKAVPGGRPWNRSRSDEPGTPYGAMPAPPDENKQQPERKTLGQLFKKVKETLSFRTPSGETVSLELSPPESGQRSGSITPYGTIPAVNPQSSAQENRGEVKEKQSKGSPSIPPEKDGKIELQRDAREAERPHQAVDAKVGQGRVSDLQKQLKSASESRAPQRHFLTLPSPMAKSRTLQSGSKRLRHSLRSQKALPT